uniref:UTP3 small subunit processome component n=1 Tax=Callorhinchus milii TaxID=7868 RepID=A0A4W3JSS9_CALMI
HGKRTSTRPKKQQEEYDSDDPQAYRDLPVPDVNSAEYFNDEVDKFHDRKVTKLLVEEVELDHGQEASEEEEEVMALDIGDSDEDEIDMESDLDDKVNDDLPNELAWGQKKTIYYSTDYDDEIPRGQSQTAALAEAEEEEQEALNIQRRMTENLTEEDFGLDLIQTFSQPQKQQEAGTEQKIQKDLKQMSVKEKMKLLKNESPELLELIQDFKAKVSRTGLKDNNRPVGANYLHTKYLLYLNYCTNISFYLVLKAKRMPAHSHPVIERLVSYRNLINDLTVVDQKMLPEIRQLLSEDQVSQASGAAENQQHSEAVREALSQTNRLPGAGQRPQEKAILSRDSESDLDEEAALQYYREMEEKLSQKRKKGVEQHSYEANAGVEELHPDGKRKITYQIAKNKGLTPKRRKIDRNPRVKHREKFRRANIRRKGQVREVRQEANRYSGELSGIRAGVKKSTKLQ